MYPRRTRKKPPPGLFSSLSDDLVALILSRLNESGDRESFSEVCKRWYKVEGDTRKSLIFDADEMPNLNLSLRVVSTRFPNLIHLEAYELSDRHIKTLAETYKKLETIILFNHDVHLGRNGLGALGNMCPNLLKVSLSGKKIGHAGVVRLLNSVSKLTRLELVCSLVGDHALGVIASASTSSITSLKLKDCCNITDHGLELLATGGNKIKSLHLDYLYCPRSRITNAGLSHLQNMSSLEHLTLKSCLKFEDHGLELLATGDNKIKSFHIKDCPKITDAGLSHLRNMRSLEDLNFENSCNITDKGLELLATGSKIKSLFMFKCPRITDTGLGYLRNMRSLEQLDLYLSQGGITDIGGVAISEIRTLKTLRLLYLHSVTDTTVLAVANNCRNLEVLDLEGCYRVTGRGIRALATHKCLKRLGLLCITQLKPSDLDTVALGCQTLEPESVLVDLRHIRYWSSRSMHANTRRVVKFSDKYHPNAPRLQI